MKTAHVLNREFHTAKGM